MGPTAYYASKFFFYFQQKQIYRYPKLEDDNPCKCGSVDVKNAKLIGPELQCLQVILLIPFWVLGPTLLSPGDFGGT